MAMAAGLAVAAPAAAKQAGAAYAGTPDDFMQISQLFSRYDYTIDNGDGLAWADVFTDDGVFRDPSWCAIGRDALIKVVGTDKRVGKDRDHFHMPSLGPIVYADRDNATIHSTVIVVRETGFGKNGGVWVTGSYDDRLKRVNGKWRIAYRLVHRPSEKPPIACAREF
jgi:hypothetical protein